MLFSLFVMFVADTLVSAFSSLNIGSDLLRVALLLTNLSPTLHQSAVNTCHVRRQFSQLMSQTPSTPVVKYHTQIFPSLFFATLPRTAYHHIDVCNRSIYC